MKDYTIQFSGLTEDMHEYRFVLGAPFFRLWETEIIRGGNVEVKVIMEKQTRMLIFHFDIDGVVEVLCDRCADPLLFPVKGVQRLIAKMSNEETSTNDDIVFISDEDFEIDLSAHLFDYLHLMLPMKMTHDDSTDGKKCDPAMIRLLQQYNQNTIMDESDIFSDDEEEEEDYDNDDDNDLIN